MAADVPYQVEQPVTEIDSLTGGVKVSWLHPFENGAPILQYHIEIKDSNGIWQQESTCDGSQQVVVQNAICVIPMSDLRTNLGLTFNSLVVFRISASNLRGQGAWSPSNTLGATIRIQPVKMQ
jgi:hypothetical protein